MLISYLVIYLVMALSFMIPFVVAWRKKGFLNVVLVTWACVVMYSAFVDFIAPIIAEVIGEGGSYRTPDVPLTLEAFIGGWVYGVIVYGIVVAVRYFIKRKE